MPASTAAQRPRKRRRPAGTLSPGAFLRNPVMVGAVAQSSGATINRMLRKVEWDKVSLFVEYGPGVGTFTRDVLDRMGPDAKLIVIDTNGDFIRYLKQSIDDPRLIAVQGSAVDVQKIIAAHGFEQADYVLSGLPFSTLPPGIGDAIVKSTRVVLRTGGAFMVYLYNPRVVKFLEPHFDHIDHEMEWVNLPPQQLWWAWKD
jgi:phospholipid N-methyltransferase